MSKIRFVKKNINHLRRRLELLVDRAGVSAPETIQCSMQLDQAINEFYRAKKSMTRSPVSCAAD